MSLRDYIPSKHKQEPSVTTPPKTIVTQRIGDTFSTAPSVARRDLARQAAEAEQRWVDLENELHYLKDMCESLRAQLKVQEAANLALKDDNQGIRAEHDRLVRENTVLNERMKMAAETIINLYKPLDLSTPQPLLDRDKLEDEIRAAEPHSFQKEPEA